MHVTASLRYSVYKTLEANQEEAKTTFPPRKALQLFYQKFVAPLLISLATATSAAASSISSSSMIF